MSLRKDFGHHDKEQEQRNDSSDALRKDFGSVPVQPISESVEPDITQFVSAYSAPREPGDPTLGLGGAGFGYLTGLPPQPPLNLPGHFGRRLWRGQRS